MARTLTQIYNDLTASKESDSTLDSLLPNPDNLSTLYNYANFKLLANTVIKGLSKSKVAIWRLMMYITAYATWMQEQLYDLFTDEVDELTTNREVGQLPWYVTKAKEFQLGYVLTWTNDAYYAYTTIDEDAQIITQAAATVSNGTIIMKVAKGEIGSLEKLDTDETTAFELYMKGTQLPYSEDGITPAGVKMNIISSDPDELRFAIEVFYNPLILDSDGVLLSDGVTATVEDAITDYIQQIPFNSKFRIIDLIDAIQDASGVENVTISHCDAKNSTQLWSSAVDVLSETGEQYVTYAGYLKMGDDYGFNSYYDYPTNLIPTITYTAET